MRSILSFSPMLFLLILCACATGYMVSTSIEKKLPPAATDADFYSDQLLTPERIALGQALFFDKILSGNKNIACSTCHSVLAATGDGLSLSLGEEGVGTSVLRRASVYLRPLSERVPRNAPALFNLGAREFNTHFLDGRVEQNASFPSGIESPAKAKLPSGLENPLAAQAMFPVTSPEEMCGHEDENELSKLCESKDFTRIWDIVAKRLQSNDQYVIMFKAAYPEIKNKNQISMVHAANAIASFETSAWRADISPFDRYLRGEKNALSRSAIDGMSLFYGKANCADCHSGTFQTDQEFHAVAMPQLGPGKGDGYNKQDDFGRERVSGKISDRYKFKTPSLRNVALTGPWGHAGAYNDLRVAVTHFLNPVQALNNYDASQAVLPPFPGHKPDDLAIMSHPESVKQIAAANEITPVQLKSDEIDQLVDFLYALTDPDSLDLRQDAPMNVPSGITVND